MISTPFSPTANPRMEVVRSRVRNRRAIDGFSLLEILIGIGIGAGILVTIYQFVQSSAQTVSLSGQHFVALHISSKLMIDLFEESRINSTVLESFGEFPDLGAHNKVVEAESPFFHHIRDSKPPWGVMEPGLDFGVTPESGEMYEVLKPFFQKLSLSRMASPDTPEPEKHLARTLIRVDWTDKSSRPHSYSLEVNCPSPSGPLPEEKFPIEEDVLKQRIKEEFFPDSAGDSFDQVVSKTGCHGEMLRRSGRLGILMLDLTASLASLSSEIRNFEKIRGPLLKRPCPALVQVQIRIARRIELGASLLFNVLLEASREAIEIRTRGNSTTLAGIPLLPFSRGLRSLRTLSTEIPNWVEKAGAAYGFLLRDDFSFALSGKEREFVMMKTLESMRLRAAIGTLPSKELDDFAKREKARIQGKNHFLERFFLREETALKNPAVFRAAFPNLVSTVEKHRDILLKTASEVPQIIALHPMTGGPK